jgi:hypothetical protein
MTRGVFQLLVTAKVVLSLLVLFTLMKEAIRTSEMSDPGRRHSSQTSKIELSQ